jgi:hypothetical protein
MKEKKIKNGKVPVLLMVLFFALFFGCSDNESNLISKEQDIAINENLKNGNVGKSVEIALEAPPFTDGIFPCNDCHSEIEPNPINRELVDMHDDITAIFDHDSENRWCLDCHDTNSRDSLRLASGKLLDFKESYKLCGQCHGVKLRDWKVGVHGKRTGEWNGKKEYLLCVHCHNPHTPKFKALVPEPPPVPQEEIN